jgi:molybdate transport system ATP-binding protein
MKLEVRCRHRFDGGFEADFDFISEHPTTALFGPSGAGKTSLLMMIAGFALPDAGRIAWGDHLLLDTSTGTNVPPEERRLGVVFQDQRLFPHLTVEANLRFGGRRQGTSLDEAAFARMVSVLELDALLQRTPRALSGGEKQRVALGRALMSSPDLLLLDEPVAAVDEPHRDTILSYVGRVVHEWRVPMLYVSHHRSEVQRLADWVIAVSAGRVAEQGPPDRVLGAGAVVAAGEPVNLLRLSDAATDGADNWFGIIAEQDIRLRLPAGSAPAKGPLFVEFAASDVMLARGDTAGLSARNRLPARVAELVPRSGRVFVALLVGEQRLWAEVTDDAVRELDLAPGVEVTCLIKSAALRVVT